MKKTATLLVFILLLFSFSACNGCYSCKGCSSCEGQSTLSAYSIDVAFDEENHLITGVQKFDFYNCYDNAFDELKFNLYGNAFRQGAKYEPISPMQQPKAYPNGVNYGNMSVSAVTSGDKELAFTIGGTDETLLTVKLDDTVYPEESTSLTIYYSLRLAEVYARTGYNSHTVNLGNFYPVLCGYNETGFCEGLYYSHGDPFFSEVADYSVSIKVPTDYKVASSGELTSVNHGEDFSTYKYSLQKARDFAMVISSEYESLSTSVGNTEINYYYYSDKNARSSLETAKKALTTFNELFGEYPYKSLAVCETGFNEGGMEYPCLVMISDALGDKQVYEEVIAHEVAHQWWYSLVGNDQTAYGFLDESLAEYSVVLFYENNPEYGLTRETLIDVAHKTYSSYCTVYEKVFGGKNTSMVRSLGEFDTAYEYVSIAYVKGALMYDGLRNGLGDELFFKGIKRYCAENSYKIATPDSLVGAFEKVGANTNGFFKSWFDGDVIL